MRFTLNLENYILLIGAACSALCIAFALGMFYLKRLRIIRAANVTTASPTFFQDASATPMWLSGALLWLLIPAKVLADDRFYDMERALAIGQCVFFGAVMLAVLPSVFTIKLDKNKRMYVRLLGEMIMAVVAVWQGIRFEIMSAPGITEGNVWLGSGWGDVISVAWIFGAMQAMKLLGGLGGSAALLLLITSCGLLWGTMGTEENTLRTITALIAGSTLGALPFYFAKNGLELRGSAMSVVAYLFAILTVLARQKAATAALVFVPMAAVLIAGVGIAIVIMDKGIKAKKVKKL